jgi:hypothetical protein
MNPNCDTCDCLLDPADLIHGYHDQSVYQCADCYDNDKETDEKEQDEDQEDCEHCDMWRKARKDSCKDCGKDFPATEEEQAFIDAFKAGNFEKVKEMISRKRNICELCLKDACDECDCVTCHECMKDFRAEFCDDVNSYMVCKSCQNKKGLNTARDKMLAIRAEFEKYVVDNKMTKEKLRKYIVDNFGAGEMVGKLSRSKPELITDIVVMKFLESDKK